MAVVKKRGTTRVSTRKTTAKKKQRKRASLKLLGVLFWILFFTVIIILFALKWDAIRQTIAESQIFERLVWRGRSGGEDPQPQLDPAGQIIIEAPPPAGASDRGDTQPPDPQAATPPQQTGSAVQTPPQETPALREWSLYLIRVDSEGDVFRIRVNRQLPVSDTPLTDVLNSLLAGPTREEQNIGLVSLIPRATRLLSAVVQGNTAYVSFSEELQYNTYGLEGHAAALRQIIWTVVEFPNIDEVQILIEGGRIDYLSEGLWIGSPLDRRF